MQRRVGFVAFPGLKPPSDEDLSCPTNEDLFVGTPVAGGPGIETWGTHFRAD